jgi:hypothetical protein
MKKLLLILACFTLASCSTIQAYFDINEAKENKKPASTISCNPPMNKTKTCH